MSGSKVVSARSLPKDQLKNLPKSLSAQEADWLFHHWPFWARPEQLAPRGDWSTWLFLGGRGAGKTRAGAEWVRKHSAAKVRVALVGETYAAARDVMVEGDSGILAVCQQPPAFISSRRRLVWKSGAVAELFSSEDPEALRGPQFHFAWCDELCKWHNAQATWDMLQFALRLGKRPQQVVTTTPRPVSLLKALLKDPQCVTTRASTYANRAHLSPAFFRAIIKRYEGTRLGRQELQAVLLDDNPDALWQRALIEKNRLFEAPPLLRIVVAVDPPASSTKAADECGIITAGIAQDGVVYVLDDSSVQGFSPTRWMTRAVAAFEEFRADRLVAEINQGGDMVEAVLRSVAPNVPFKGLRAFRGKRARAEPVAALYEQGRVRHVGVHPLLEDQLCAFDGMLSGGASPDRLDALVWAVTDLTVRRDCARLRFL